MERVLGVLLDSLAADFVVAAGKAYLSYVFGATMLEVRAFVAGESTDQQTIAASALESYPHVLEFARLEADRLTAFEAAERDLLQGLRILLDGFRQHSREESPT